MVRRIASSLCRAPLLRSGARLAWVLSGLLLPAAAPAAWGQSQSGFTYNGMVYVSYQANEYLETPQGPQGAAAIRGTGANYTSVVATQYVQTSTSNTIAPETATTPGYNSSKDPLSPTDSAVTAAIQNLQAQGLIVFLKPQVDSLDGIFRGNFAPTDTAAWFSSYQSFILHYAQLAYQNHVGGLVIGTELKSLSGSAYESYWDAIIAQIRASYPSLTLIYGANATGAGDEFTTVSFWDKVDIIGVDGYFPLTGQPNPTVAQLVAAWSNNKNGFDALDALKALQSRYQKPLIFTELGYVSATGTNEAPYSSALPGAAYDPTEQENCYEAFFEVFSQQSSWMKGVFWWAWNVSPPGSADTGYTPQDKPAGTVTLPKWYGSTSAGFSLAASNASLALGQGLSAQDTISVTSLGGFTGAVALAASGLPPGVTASFGAGTGAGTQALTLSAGSSATTGPATVTVTGTSGSLSASTTVALNLQTASLQTISFANPGTQAQGTSLALAATATSGLAVSFSTSTPGVCTLSGTTASFVASGTCTVTASQAGNAVYAAAMPVGQSFSVSALALAPVPTAADVVFTQLKWLDALTGYVQTSNNPSGGSFAVNDNGAVAVADTNKVYLVNPETGATATLGSWSGASPVAVDSKNNLYIGTLYGSPAVIAKLPYTGASTNGGYAAFTTPTGTTPVCTAGGTTLCTVPNLGSVSPSALALDAAGDLFWITSSDGATGGNGIYECTVACLGGGGAPVLLYQEPRASATPSASSGQLIAGGLAVDPSGNLFFTDSSTYVNTASYAYTSFYSHLNELARSTGVGYNGLATGYAPAPSVLYTLTPSSIGSYDNELDAVAVNQTTGTVYFADNNDGTFAFPNTGGPISLVNGQPSALYAVSPQGAKTLTIDQVGNLYLAASSTAINSSGADTVAQLRVGNVTLPASPTGTPASTPTYSSSQGTTSGQVFAAVNDGAAAPSLSLAATQFGTATPEFAATPGGGSALLVGTAFPVTVSYTPVRAGERAAVLLATDTATGGGAGMATASGVGQGALLALDPGVATVYPALASSGFNPAGVVRTDAAGNLFVPSGSALFEIPAGAPASATPTQIASGFGSIADMVFDPNGNLYLADDTNQEVVEIPNVDGTLVAKNQLRILSKTTLFGGTPLSTPVTLAIGPDGVLYIGDTGSENIDTFNPANGALGVRVTGVKNIAGLAVNAQSDLYAATAGTTGSLSIYSGAGVVTESLGGILPEGLALDASGSVWLTDRNTASVVRIPTQTGGLNVSGAMAVEKIPGTPGPASLDAKGNLYVTGGSTASVYAIQRSAAALTFADTVSDGSTSSPLSLYLENAGNTALTGLATAAPGGPFSLLPGATACTAALAAGQGCDEQFTFSPTGTMTGAQTGSSTIASSANSATVALAGTAAAAPASQTIGFANPGAQTVGTPLTLSATASSGLAVTFTSATTAVCTVSGTAATFLAPGTCTLDADQAGDATHAAAAEVAQSFTVSGSPSFTLAPAAAAVAVTQGSTATDTINVTAANSFSGPVMLAATGLPSGVTASFATNPSTGSNGVTFTATSAAAVGAAMVTITGTSGSLAASTTIALTVSAPAAFGLAPTAASVSVNQGSTATDTINITAANGFSGNVMLAVTGLPTGVTAAFATNPATGSSGLTFTAASTAATGPATVTVTGVSGSLTESTSIALTVNVPAGLSLAPSSATVSVAPGASATDSISVAGTGGFTGTVTLTAAVTSSPAGAQDLPTVSFGSTGSVNVSGAGGGSATLTISTTAATSAALASAHPAGGLEMATGAALGCLLLLGASRRRTLPRLLLLFALLAAFTGGLTGCGGGSKGTTGGGGNSGTTAGAYTVTVTATSAAAITTGTVTVNVQ